LTVATSTIPSPPTTWLHLLTFLRGRTAYAGLLRDAHTCAWFDHRVWPPPGLPPSSISPRHTTPFLHYLPGCALQHCFNTAPCNHLVRWRWAWAGWLCLLHLRLACSTMGSTLTLLAPGRGDVAFCALPVGVLLLRAAFCVTCLSTPRSRVGSYALGERTNSTISIFIYATWIS